MSQVPFDFPKIFNLHFLSGILGANPGPPLRHWLTTEEGGSKFSLRCGVYLSGTKLLGDLPRYTLTADVMVECGHRKVM